MELLEGNLFDPNPAEVYIRNNKPLMASKVMYEVYMGYLGLSILVESFLYTKVQKLRILMSVSMIISGIALFCLQFPYNNVAVLNKGNTTWGMMDYAELVFVGGVVLWTAVNLIRSMRDDAKRKKNRL